MNPSSKYFDLFYNYILDGDEPKQKELKIVFDILKDLGDRRGLRQEFDNIDGEIQDEIIEKWVSFIKK